MHKLKVLLILLVLGLEQSCGSPAKDIEVSQVTGFYSPSLGMTLGRGFDPTRPLEPRGDCLANVEEATKTSWVDADGIKGNFTETQLKSMADLHRELAISGSVAGEALWGSANSSYSKFEKFMSNENSFTWLVNFSVHVGERTLSGNKLKLTPQAQQLVDAGRLDDFYKMCGTEYIRSVKLGGKLVIVHEIEAKYKELVERIKQSIQVGSSRGAWGFSGSAQYDSYFNEASFRSVLKREIEQIGGSSIDVNRLTPDKLGDYLTQYEHEMRAQNATVVGIETAAWDTLGVTNVSTFASWHRKSTITDLYNQYRFNQETLSKISDYAYWMQQGYYHISESDMQRLNKDRTEISNQNQLIEAKANACIQSNSCDASGLIYIMADFPTLVDQARTETFGGMNYVVPTLWSFYASNAYYDQRNVRMYEVPPRILQDAQLSSFLLLVYTTPCRSAGDFLAEQSEGLKQRGVRHQGVDRLDDSLTYRLSWQNHHPERLYAKQLDASTCGVIKMSVGATPGTALKAATEQNLESMAKAMTATHAGL